MDCGLAVESSEQKDSASWYKLWQETNAIFAHCLRKGQSGYSERLGEQGLAAIMIYQRELTRLFEVTTIISR